MRVCTMYYVLCTLYIVHMYIVQGIVHRTCMYRNVVYDCTMDIFCTLYLYKVDDSNILSPGTAQVDADADEDAEK